MIRFLLLLFFIKEFKSYSEFNFFFSLDFLFLFYSFSYFKEFVLAFMFTI